MLDFRDDEESLHEHVSLEEFDEMLNEEEGEEKT
jgi:hypothetical protein